MHGTTMQENTRHDAGLRDGGPRTSSRRTAPRTSRDRRHNRRGPWRTRRLALLAGAAAVAACGDPIGPGEKIEKLPRELTVAEQAVISASNRFAFELLREVRAREDEPNIFLSPLSASMALGMTLNGANGATFDGMRRALGFEGLSQAEINESYRGLMRLLLGLDARVEMHIANATWARRGFPFEPAFFETVRQYFDARAQELDFDDPGAKDVINGWVREKTGGRIPSIVDRIGPLDILFLTNAVYFKGNWTSRFDRGRTRQAPFHLESGQTVQVPMMSGTVRVGVGRSGGAVIGELPYGGEAFAMIVVPAPPGGRLADLIARLDDRTWDDWMAAIRYEDEAPVELPRFELEYAAWLNDALKAMGMEIAFVPELADFSRMTPAPDAYISRVRHKTFLKVDEEGTEAAGATSVGVGITSAPAGLTVDRPFLLAIRERHSGAILFLGAIADPR